MNRIILMGRLTKAPEIRYTQTGKCVAQFTLAVDRMPDKDGNKTADFINVVLWGKSAEILGNSVTKGQRILVEGRLQIRSYEDQAGGKRWITEVVANNFEYIEKKSDKQSGVEQFGSQTPFDEEIPF